MPIPVTSPIVPDPIPPATQQSIQYATNGRVGPWTVGSNLYIAFLSNIGGGISGDIAVYKSTDGGATWTRQHTAGSPYSDGGYDAVFEPSTGLIHFVYETPAAVDYLTYCSFDTNTDTFSTEVQDTGVAFPGLISIVVVPSGDVVAFYTQDVDATTNTLYTNRFVAGAWTGQSALIVTATGNRCITQGCETAGGTDIYLFYQQFPDGGGTQEFRFLPMDISSTPGTVVVLGTATTLTNQMQNVVVWNDRIVVGFLNLDDFANPTLQVWVGTPIAAPVWTKYDVRGFDADLIDTTSHLVAIDGSTLWIFYVTAKISDNFSNMYYVEYDGTSFAAPTLYYDVEANPPPTGALSPNFMSKPSGGLDSGELAMMTQAFIDGSGDVGALYLPTTVSPGPPTNSYVNEFALEPL